MSRISPNLAALSAQQPLHSVQRAESSKAHAKHGESDSAIAPKDDVLQLSAKGLARAIEETSKSSPDAEKAGAKTEAELTEGEREQVRELAARDREVRAHEQAHKAAGGDLAGSPSYEYEQGPDGKRYAVSGEVSISLRGGNTPEETASNARRVRAAALAPAHPSGQDLAVAASAAQAEQTARAEQAEATREERVAEADDSEAESVSGPEAEAASSLTAEASVEPEPVEVEESGAPEPATQAAIRATNAYAQNSSAVEAASSLLDLVA